MVVVNRKPSIIRHFSVGRQVWRHMILVSRFFSWSCHVIKFPCFDGSFLGWIHWRRWNKTFGIFHWAGSLHTHGVGILVVQENAGSKNDDAKSIDSVLGINLLIKDVTNYALRRSIVVVRWSPSLEDFEWQRLELSFCPKDSRFIIVPDILTIQGW